MDLVQRANKLYVFYAKYQERKNVGIDLEDVYFAGLADDHIQAEQIARRCVNTTKGGTIITKFKPANNDLVHTMYHVTDDYHDMLVDMVETDKILRKAKK